LADRMRRRFGKPVDVTAAVDPRLLGGFRFRVDDKVYDYSVRGALDAMRAKLARAQA
jgi:F0F1-type ATP synthase delta subunit